MGSTNVGCAIASSAMKLALSAAANRMDFISFMRAKIPRLAWKLHLLMTTFGHFPFNLLSLAQP